MTARTLSHHLLILTLSLCTITRLHAQTPPPKCDWAAFDRSAADLRAARDAAMQIPEDERNTEVPPEAIKQIQQFKNSLYAALQSYFLCQPNLAPESKALETGLYSRLAIPVPPPPDKRVENQNRPGPEKGLYLSNVTIKVQTAPDARKLIAVLTTFGIPYGEDAELDIFDSSDGGARQPAVHFTSRPYNSIAGAFQGFDYKISPADPKGNWFVAATHVNPWPSSCWQNLYIDALRPNERGMEYQLFHDEQSGYICDDTAPYLRSVTANTFQVRFSINSIDESQRSSTSLMLYKVEGDEVTRIQPVALNPVNFADEWTRRTWRDAQGWSDPVNLAKLRDEHASLHSPGAPDGDFVAVRACTAAAARPAVHTPTPPLTFEVEFKPADGDGPSRFFLVRKNPDGFTMLKVTDRPTSSCHGPNLIMAVKDR